MTQKHSGRPSWFLDELTSLGRKNSDETHVARYDEKEDAGAAAEIKRLRGFFPDRQRTVIDLGAGTGQFSLLAAEHSEEGGWTRRDLEEHVRDEHSTFTWLLEPIIVQAGFTIEEAAYSDNGIFAQYLLRAA